MEAVILKKVMDGKIKTPIPAPLIKPMMRVEDWWEKKELQNQKLMHKINQKLPKFLLGKDREQVLETDRELIANQEAKIREKEQTKKDIRDLEEKFGDKKPKTQAKVLAKAATQRPTIAKKPIAQVAPKAALKVPAFKAPSLKPSTFKPNKKPNLKFTKPSATVGKAVLTQKKPRLKFNAKPHAKVLGNITKPKIAPSLDKSLKKVPKGPGFKGLSKVKIANKDLGSVTKKKKLPTVSGAKKTTKVKISAHDVKKFASPIKKPKPIAPKLSLGKDTEKIEKPKLNVKEAKKVSTNKDKSERTKKAEKTPGSTLNVSPKNGICVCPICGTRHVPGQHSHGDEELEAQKGNTKLANRVMPEKGGVLKGGGEPEGEGTEGSKISKPRGLPAKPFGGEPEGGSDTKGSKLSKPRDVGAKPLGEPSSEEDSGQEPPTKGKFGGGPAPEPKSGGIVSPTGNGIADKKGLKKLVKGSDEDKAAPAQNTKIARNMAKLSPTMSKPLEDNKGNGEQNDISSAKASQYLGKIGGNLQETIKDKKTSKAFMLNYAPLQKGITKQMGEIDKEEGVVAKDTAKTQKGIDNLKKQGNKKGPGSGIVSWLLNPLGSLMLIVVGGLLIISLVRLAIRKWAEAYMPQTDGSTMTIFGFKMPGWDTIKAIGIGVWNWITVGLPNYWERLKFFFGDIYRKLFGKKGLLKNGARTMSVLKRIVWAWIIGIAKKGYGWFFQILSFALSFIPGCGPVLSFICKLLPAVITFIWTQIMLMWSKKGAETEEDFKSQLAAQKLTGKKAVAKLKADVLKSSRNVKPFKGAKVNVPGLQTAKKSNGRYELDKGAIMQKVPVHKLNKNYKVAQKLQNEQFEKSKEEREERYKKAIYDAKSKTSIAQKLIRAGQKHQKEANDYDETSVLVATWDDMKQDAQFKENLKNTIINESLIPEIRKIDAYIAQLAKSTRFKNVTGPLYDVATGWNPGYTVKQSDLMTPIPLEPFEEIHSKLDIPFGTPDDEGEDYKGIMPFTWFQDGVRISVHPINYEIARAKAIRKIYEWAIEELVDSSIWDDVHIDLKNFKEKTLVEGMGYWDQWNRAVGEHDIGDYENPDTVLFQDKFGKFLSQMKQGKITAKDNNIAKAADMRGEGWWDRNMELIDNLGTIHGAAVLGAEIGTFVPVIGAAAGAVIGAVVGTGIKVAQATG